MAVAWQAASSEARERIPTSKAAPSGPRLEVSIQQRNGSARLRGPPNRVPTSRSGAQALSAGIADGAGVTHTAVV
jgi:hypothetical protein